MIYSNPIIGTGAASRITRELQEPERATEIATRSMNQELPRGDGSSVTSKSRWWVDNYKVSPQESGIGFPLSFTKA